MAKKISALVRGKQPFRADAKLDRSQVEDLRLDPMRRTEHWEDGSMDYFARDHAPGGLHPKGRFTGRA